MALYIMASLYGYNETGTVAGGTVKIVSKKKDANPEKAKPTFPPSERVVERELEEKPPSPMFTGFAAKVSKPTYPEQVVVWYEDHNGKMRRSVANLTPDKSRAGEYIMERVDMACDRIHFDSKVHVHVRDIQQSSQAKK